MDFIFDEENSLRLDKFLAFKLTDVSRSRISKLVKNGKILVNGSFVKSSFSLHNGDKVFVPEIKDEVFELKSDNVELEILYENDDLFVINKPAGMVVHPSDDGQNMRGTVASAVMGKVEEGVGANLRPGIVHRLDKETSGALVIAKTEKAYTELVRMLKARDVKKKYYALVYGGFADKEGIIDSPIGRALNDRKKMRVSDENTGREAITAYKVVDEFDFDREKFSLLDVRIMTGRTHQIRVHMSAIGHPVVGDDKYGNRKINVLFKKMFGLDRQFLHAYSVEFDFFGEHIYAKDDLPEDLESVLEGIKL